MPPSTRTISQQAFESLVKENIDDLGMDPDEALDDAVQTLSLQGVDLSGIIRCVPGVSSVGDHPVIRSIGRIKGIGEGLDEEGVVGVLDEFCGVLSSGEDGVENMVVAVKNGAVEVLVSVFDSVKFEKGIVSGLKVLSLLLRDAQGKEIFRRCDGPKVVVGILNGKCRTPDVLDGCFAVVAAASTGDELLKESFMLLKVDEVMVQVLHDHLEVSLHSLYDAICAVLNADDNRVVASQVYGCARKFAKIGIADALVRALSQGLRLSTISSVCTALKAVAVNDEICKSISENGGIEAAFRCMDESVEQNNKIVARPCCSLLAKLAASDANKIAIVEKGGLERLMKLASTFSEDPTILQEVMSIITVLSLRSPENAARSVEAGFGDLAMQAMEKFPSSFQMQKQSCFMIRNLVVRNPENRTLLLNNGIEKLIRKAKGSHASVKDAATAALRDLGLDDYNT